MPSVEHLNNFRQLVEDLTTVAAQKPDDEQGRIVRNLAFRSLCAFALLRGEHGAATTLEGPEVTNIIENAIHLASDPGTELAPSTARN